MERLKRLRLALIRSVYSDVKAGRARSNKTIRLQKKVAQTRVLLQEQGVLC